MDNEEQEFRRGRHVVYDLKAHLVFVTKYRRGVISAVVRESLMEAFAEVCKNLGATLEEVDGEDDHIHLLVSYPPKLSLSVLVNRLKTNSSRLVRERHMEEVSDKLWGKHFWSPSYFAASIGYNGEEAVRHYIRDQRLEPRGPGNPGKQN